MPQNQKINGLNPTNKPWITKKINGNNIKLFVKCIQVMEEQSSILLKFDILNNNNKGNINGDVNPE